MNKTKKSVVNAFRKWINLLAEYGPAIKEVLAEADNAFAGSATLPVPLRNLGLFKNKYSMGIVAYQPLSNSVENKDDDRHIFLVINSLGAVHLGVGGSDHGWNDFPVEKDILWATNLDYIKMRGIVGISIESVKVFNYDLEVVASHLESLILALYCEAKDAKRQLNKVD